ncbi:MAG: hypothetical protein HHAS10_04160 [Candidatus Altimarinota bacterium]
MDFLFLNHSASVEAIIVFFCLGIILLFLIYDATVWVKQKYRELYPRKAYTEQNSIETKDDSNSIQTPAITLETIDDELKNVENSTQENLDTENKGVIEDESQINLTGDASFNENDIKLEEASLSIDSITEINGENSVNDSHIEESTDVSEGSPEFLASDSLEGKSIEEINNNQEPHEAEKAVQENAIEANTENKKSNHLNHSKKEKSHDDEFLKETKKRTPLSPEKKEKVLEIVNNAKTLIARGHIDEARALIVNGLSLEKSNRDLNLLMAGLYERDHAFEKAEFVLKELAENDSNDVEILTHLATVVAMQRKFEVSYEIYKKILSLSGETEEILYTLSHIASELGLTDDVYAYSKLYLKQYPKNPEILWLYSQSQITKGERRGAIETLIKLKNLTPYNQEIIDLISKLVTEDELAGNFGEKQL